MNSYAISSCVLEKTVDDKKIITNILHKLSDDSTPFRVAVDKKGKIIDIYEQIANENNVHIASWLKLLTREPKQIETIDVELDLTKERIYIFLDMASKIRNQKKLIVYSHDIIPEEFVYDNENVIKYGQNHISIYNSNEAITELNSNKYQSKKNMPDMPSTNINITNNNDNSKRSSAKSFKYSILALIAILGSGVAYKYYPFVGTSNNKNCSTITITGAIEDRNQSKIKSVQLEEQTYAEDNSIVEGKFELKQVAPIKSTQITLLIKYVEGIKERKISIPLRTQEIDNNCLVDIGRVK